MPAHMHNYSIPPRTYKRILDKFGSDPKRVIDQLIQEALGDTTTHQVANPNTPPPLDAGWPLDDAALTYCHTYDVDPDLMQPNPNIPHHIEYRKMVIRVGWRCEGMRDPEKAQSLIARDIRAETPLKEMTESALNASSIMRQEFNKWWRSRRP